MVKQKDNNYILYALGTRGSRPVHGKDYEIFGGQTTCFIIKHKKHAIIIDCGTGLYDAEYLLSDCEVIDIIFTHVHYDHILGLLDFSIFPKNARINLIGTFKKWLSYDTIEEFYRHPFWPIQPRIGILCEITDDGHKYNLADGITLEVYKASHPDGGNILALEVNGVRVCALFDNEVTKDFDMHILDNCKYLLFDGMFADSEYSLHAGWGHSTYQEGCRMATVCNAKELLITHHNPKNNDKELLNREKNAKQMFACTRFLRAGDMFVIE